MLLRRLQIPLLLALGLALQGQTCTGGGDIAIVSPAEGVDVTTPSFTVQIFVNPGAFDVSTLTVTLNGVALAVAGGPPTYTASVNPGSPLRDQNVLEVRVRALNGTGAVLTRSFNYLPPKARLRRITSLADADLPSGPLAQRRVGDYLLENDVARFVVQDVAQRDLHSIGAFGGNLIDAELVGHPGKENFFEIQPAINIETVLNAQTAEIVNDGQDGTPAVLRVCGPDDLIDYVNPSTVVSQAGGIFPSGVDDLDLPVEACTEYQLAAGKSYVSLDTTVENLSGNTLPLYVGDYVNGMGELEQWTPPAPSGIPGAIGIGEMTTNFSMDALSYFGFGEAKGVDYAFLGADPPLAPSTTFTVSGVSYVMHAQSIPLILFFGQPSSLSAPPNGSLSFVRHFGVGDGSGANALAMEADVRGIATQSLSGCVTVGGTGGAAAAGARISMGAVGTSGTYLGKLQTLRATFITDDAGCYHGRVAPGTYGIAAARDGTPYEGGGTSPLIHTITVTSGSPVVQDFALPATGRVQVTVQDENGVPVPARVTVVGIDPSPEPKLVTSVVSGNDTTTGTFNDVSKDPLEFGTTHVGYAGADGVHAFDLEPGTYQIFVSRGTEYSAFSAPLTVGAGATVSVAAQIAHVLQTPGFVSSDFHVHALNSPDSRVNNDNRVAQFAGEGVDNIIMTDHDAHTDLTPHIAALGLTPFVHSTIGEEITTFDYGHYNAYPLGIDPTKPSGGSTDHGGAAPPGQDFPSAGHYDLTPAEIDAAVRANPWNTSPELAVQINHIDSHFDPLKIDTGVSPPQSFLTPAEQLGFRLDPSVPNLFHLFNGLELWNGYNRPQALCEFLAICTGSSTGGRIGIWMNLLNQGLIATAIADTDTHEFFNTRSGGARSWTPSSTDAPAGIVDDEIGAAVHAGKAVGGQGLYVQTRLLATDGSGGSAGFGLNDATMLSVNNGQANLQIDVQAPLWAEYDRIEIYVNAQTRVSKRNPNTAGGTPTLYGANPTIVLTKDTDFTRTTVTDFPAIPGAGHFETHKTLTLSTPQDAWIVVVVRGTDGVSKPMFPEMPASLSQGGNNTTLAGLLDGNLNEGGVLAQGFTNALFVDANGNGSFDPPGLSIAP